MSDFMAILASRSRPIVTAELPALGWHGATTGPLRERTAPGFHWTVLHRPNVGPLGAIIAEDLGNWGDAIAQAQIPYDVHIFGNHEFDYGPDFLARYIAGFGGEGMSLDQPFISANLDFSAEPAFAEWIDEDVVRFEVTVPEADLVEVAQGPEGLGQGREDFAPRAVPRPLVEGNPVLGKFPVRIQLDRKHVRYIHYLRQNAEILAYTFFLSVRVCHQYSPA